jgi:hypothetical protein
MAQRFSTTLYYWIAFEQMSRATRSSTTITDEFEKKGLQNPRLFSRGFFPCAENCTLMKRHYCIGFTACLYSILTPIQLAIHKWPWKSEYNGASSIFIKTPLNKKSTPCLLL